MNAKREDPATGWARWGEPGRAMTLPDSVARLLTQVFDVSAAPAPAELTAVALEPCALDPAVREALAAAVGAEHVHTDTASRARHSAGKSTPDLLRQRAGDLPAPPEAVVCPADHDEVVAVLRACSEHRVAVVPFGGGTSVVGGLVPGIARHIALDLHRLDQLAALDPVSRTATLQAGLRAPRADELLAGHGYTLGHVPQSYEYATIGGFAATRSSGQASAGYGRFDDMVVALTVATPQGTLHVGRAPASSAGPDLRQLFLGSEGALGVITDVTVRVRPVPTQTRYEGWRFESFTEGLAAVRRLAQDGPRPSVLRLSDEMETAIGATGSGRSDGGCLLITGYEGANVDPIADAVAAILAEHGATPVGAEAGQQWAQHRFDAPYLRDALLDAGAFAETLETAAFWSALPNLYDGVRTALIDALDGPAIVLCHVSHIYETGGSLYFTVVTAPGDDPLRRWTAAKSAANDAIGKANGTISHHHGVGTEHRDWYAVEIGPLAVDALRALKRQIDPNGILNPGILVP